MHVIPSHNAVVPPSSCKQLGTAESGLYTLNIGDRAGEFCVFCHMDEAVLGGGWILIQRRSSDASKTYFDKDWKSYKNGFGTFNGSFWLGLEKIHRITHSADQYELYIGMQSVYGVQRWAHYTTFQVGNEASKYTLTVGGYQGSAGNSLDNHNGAKFSTLDQNNDNVDNDYCTQKYSGGWWFNGCHDSNLNGRYYGNGFAAGEDGISWHGFLQPKGSLIEVIMAIRPHN